MKDRILSICLITLVISNHLIGQTPSFELKRPVSSPDINADFLYNDAGAGEFADYDGDGDLDFLQLSRQNSKYLLFENDGLGNFSNLGIPSFNDYLPIVSVGDFTFEDVDGDMITDLLSAVSGFDSTTLYLGDGAGNFISSGVKFHSCHRGQVSSVDFDSDGDMDVIVAGEMVYSSINLKETRVMLYLNDGAENFTVSNVIDTLGSYSRFVVTQPFDGNKRNLIVPCKIDGVFKICLFHYDGAGNTSLISSTMFDAALSNNTFEEAVLGDINGNGIEDIVIYNEDDGVKIFLNNGPGDYTSYTHLSGSSIEGKGAGITGMIQAGDIDGDSDIDVVCSYFYSGVEIYQNDGAGNFTMTGSHMNGEFTVGFILADITRDGYPDLYEWLEQDTEISNLDPASRLSNVLVNNGDGTFDQVINNAFKEVGEGSVLVADFDADGNEDVFTIGREFSEDLNQSDLFLNDGSGNFTESTSFLQVNMFESAAAVIDFNQDQYPDILASGVDADNLTWKIELYQNDGSGGFSQNYNHPFEAVVSGDILVLDANDDYNPDILITGEKVNGQASTKLYLGTGEGGYKAKAFTGLSLFKLSSSDAGDIDGDGDQDLIICGKENDVDQTILYLNEGTGNFTAASSSFQGISDGDVKFMNLDSDGYPDVVLAGSGYQQVYMNDGTGSYSLTQSLEGLNRSKIEGNDVDEDGDTDFVSTGESTSSLIATSTLYVNDGTGNFSDGSMNLRGVENASIVFADFDGDYDKELILVGSEGNNVTSNPASGAVYKYNDHAYVSRVYENTGMVATVNKTISTCDSYYFIDETLTVSGTYNKMITTPEGDNRQINLDLTIYGSTSETVDLAVNGSYLFNGKLLTESGAYESTLLSSHGCDSTVTLNLTIGNSVSALELDTTSFELIQPASVGKHKLELEIAKEGAGIFYDMDGDGDRDYLQIGDMAVADEVANVYLNDGCGQFVRQENPENLLPFESIEWSHPRMTYADFNEDGINDLLIGGDSEPAEKTVNEFGPSHLFWGNANGGLTLNTDLSMPSINFGNFSVADFNNDTHLDILVSGLNDVKVFFNDGTGTFVESSTTAFDGYSIIGSNTVSEPYDGGIRDIVLSALDAGFADVTILFRSDASGNITLISESALAPTFIGIHQFADVNNDGNQDLLITGNSFLTTKIKTKLYIGDGAGNYAVSAFNFDGIKLEAGYLQDLNRDNVAEIILYDEGSIHVFWNDGTGSFSAADNYTAGTGHTKLAIGDFNEDEYPDLLATGSSTAYNFDTFYYLNDQSNGFVKGDLNVTDEVRAGEASFVNIDGDSDLDLIVVGRLTEETSSSKVYLNDGNGNFSESMVTALVEIQNADFALADIDGNTSMDLLVIGDTLDVPSTYLYTNDGTGSFTAVSGVPFEAVSSGDVLFLNADDNPSQDLLIVGQNVSSTGVANLYLNDGSGLFTLHAAGLTGVSNADIAVGDVDGDLDIDVLITGIDATDSEITMLYFNDGNGNFTAIFPNNFVGIADGAASLVDLDGDLDLDIYLSGNGEHVTYHNDGAGNFTLAQFFQELWRSSVAFSDVDDDGDVDFISSGENASAWNSEREIHLYVNDGAGNFSQTPSTLFAAMSDGSISFGDIDSDADDDLFFIGNAYRDDSNVSRLFRNTIGDARKLIWANNGWNRLAAPTAVDEVIIKDDYASGANGEFEMGSLEISNGHTLTIDPATTLDITGNLQNNGSIVVESGGSLLTYEANTIIGNPITFNRNTRYADNRYSMVGSPVETNIEITGSDLAPIVYTYDETIDFNDGTEDGINRWLNASTDVLQPGVGYAAAGQEVITFSGVPNDGTIAFTGLSRTEDATTTSDNWGWHLVSNPYPAAIDLDAFISGNANIQGSIALWDDHGSDTGRGTNADYLIANVIGSVSGPNGGQFEGYIGSMQGFFVQVGDGQTGDLTFTESMRVGANNSDATFFRKTESHIQKIKLVIRTEGGKHSETLIGFPEDASEGFDRFYDATKLKSQPNFNIYSVLGDRHLAIQGLPLEDDMIVPIGLDLTTKERVTLSLTESLEDYDLFLRNNETGEMVSIDINESINVSDQGSQEYSLVLRSAEVTSIEDKPSSMELVAYSDGTRLQLMCDQCSSPTDIQVINLSGKVISMDKSVRFVNGKYGMRKPTQGGLYIVRLASQQGAGYTKVIIK